MLKAVYEDTVTYYKVTGRGEGYSKVHCIPETGRTYQIRILTLSHPIT